jgi:hypothetical protein
MGDVKTSTGSAATEGDSTVLQQGNAAFAAGDYEAAGAHRACVRAIVR